MALLHVDFYSNVLGRGMHMDAILPEHSPAPQWRTLYLLHGKGNDQSSWQRFTGIERLAEERKLAVIIPDGDLRWYTDTRYGEDYFEFVSCELVQLSRRMFPRLSRERGDSFVAGNSMGGYGAFKCALRHPETFSKAASLSGTMDIVTRVTMADVQKAPGAWEDIFGPLDALAGSENDLLAAARACTRNRPELWLWCGTEDFLYQMSLRMRDALREMGYRFVYSDGSGNHRWAHWDAQLPRMLDWLLGEGADACR